MSKNIIDAIYVALGLDNAEYKKGIKEAGDTSHKFAKDEEKRDKARQDSHKKLTEAERSAAKDRSRHEKERDVQARNAITQLNTMKSTVMSMMGLSLGAMGVQKFLSVVINSNAELYRQSRMLNTEMKTLDVWMRTADNYRKGSGQGVVGALQGIQQARMQALHGTGGKEQMSGLMRSGINPQLVNDPDKFLRTVRSRVKGKSSQEQLFWLSQWGGEGLLPLTMQSDKEFEENLSYANSHSAKNQEQGKTAYDIESNQSKTDHNIEATADKVSNDLLKIIEKLTRFLTEHADAVGLATIAISALGTAAFIAAGVRGLGALIKGPGAIPGGGGGSGGSLGGARSFAALSRLGVGAGLALYSPDLNSGEDENVRQGHIGLPGYDAQGNHLPNLPSGGGRMVGGRIGRLGGVAKSGQSGSPREQALSYFQSQGWSAEQAAGIVANLEKESQLNTGAIGDGGEAVGIAQWHPDRQNKFRSLYGENLKGAPLEKQMAFVQWELENTERGAGSMLRGAKTAKEAGVLFSQFYERPDDKTGRVALSRGNSAETILEQSRSLIAAGQSSGSMINSNNQTAEVRIDNINIQADTKDVNIIASSLPNAIKSAGILPGFVRGQN